MEHANIVSQKILDSSCVKSCAPLRPLPPVSPKCCHDLMQWIGFYESKPLELWYAMILWSSFIQHAAEYSLKHKCSPGAPLQKDESQDKSWMVLIRTTVFNIRLTQQWTFSWILVITSMLYHVVRVINFISILKKTSASGSWPSTAINRHQPLQSSFSSSWPLPGYWFHRLYHDGSSTHKRMDLFGALLNAHTKKHRQWQWGKWFRTLHGLKVSESSQQTISNDLYVSWSMCLVISAPTSPSMLHPSRPVLPHMWALEDNSTWPWQLKADKLMPVEKMLGMLLQTFETWFLVLKSPFQ